MSAVRIAIVREQDLQAWLAQGKGPETASARQLGISCVEQMLRRFGLFPFPDGGERSVLVTLSTAV